MSAYQMPIKTALFVFPFLAFLISFVFIIYEYRKYGTFLLRRALILYSFIFYLLCAYFLVILPLPPRAEVSQYTSQYLELRPFLFVHRFMQDSVLTIRDPHTYVAALKQNFVLEPLFNVLLLVPFGVYLRYYFGYSFKKVLAATFCLSAFFELTQLTGLYFIYPRPYRLADVNDLITNTFGGLIGYVITPMLTFLFPTRAELDEAAYQKGQSVSLFRRFVAFLIDWLLLSFVETGVFLLLRMVPRYLNWMNNYPTATTRIGYFIMVFFVFILLPTITNGETLGKKVVKIRIVEAGHTKIQLKALIIRYGYLYFLYGFISMFLTDAGNLLNGRNHLLQLVSFMLFLFCLLLLGLFVLNVCYVGFFGKKQLFYEKASHTYTVSTIKRKKNEENP